MPTPTKGPRFGGSPSHQRLILANLAQNLIEHGQITTTEAKAKRLRPYVEHLVTKAKTDTVANRRQVVKVIRDKAILNTLFTEIGPSMATRPGGYTRITKVGARKGDNAPMAIIEFVEPKEFAAQTSQAPAAEKPAPAAPEEPVAEEPVAEETGAEESADEVPAVEPDVQSEPTADEVLEDESPAVDAELTDEATSDEATSDEATSDEATATETSPEADDQK